MKFSKKEKEILLAWQQIALGDRSAGIAFKYVPDEDNDSGVNDSNLAEEEPDEEDNEDNSEEN